MEVLKKLEDQLKCAVCLDTYTDPKQLGCHHVFCQKCLVKLVIRDQQGQLILTCPNCREITPVPASGVAGLQSAFDISKILEIVQEHKQSCMSFQREHQVQPPSSYQEVSIGCPDHESRKMELYCHTCENIICLKCIMKGEKYHTHNYQELDKAFKKFQKDITLSLEPLQKHVSAIELALDQVSVRDSEIAKQQAAIEENINQTFITMRQSLDARNAELIGHLRQLSQAKFKSLEEQKYQLQTTLARLKNCLLLFQDSTENKAEFLANRVKQAKELAATFQPELLKPAAETDLVFSIAADGAFECQKVGQVSSKAPIDPTSCYATGVGVTTATAGETATAVLHLPDSSLVTPETSITCEIVSELTGGVVSGTVARKKFNQFELSYSPAIKGRHLFHIRVDDQDICGSPFPTTVAGSLMERLGFPVLIVEDVVMPEGVAFSEKGKILVAEKNKGRLRISDDFGPNKGLRLKTFTEVQSFPNAVAFDGEDNVFVADYKNHRVQKFSPLGENLDTVGTKGYKTLQFCFPCSIAFNFSNSKVYVGDLTGRIQILSSDLHHCDTFGERGSGEGEMNVPEAIACDSAGNVYVADSHNSRIQVFTAEGKFVRVFGKHREGQGGLNFPHGVALDSMNRVYVSERSSDRVSIFDADGHFLSSFGKEGNRPGEFKEPRRIAVDSSGVVCVCDHDNNRLQFF